MTDNSFKLCYPCSHYRPKDGESPPDWPDTAPIFWRELAERSLEDVVSRSGAEILPEGRIGLSVLNERWTVDPVRQAIEKTEGNASKSWNRQLPFLILVYLSRAKSSALTGEMTPPRDLFPGMEIFKGLLELETGGLLRAYGSHGNRFSRACLALGGRPLDKADRAFRFELFPKFPVEFLLWLEDDEFPPNLTILVDRGAAVHLPPDAMAALINGLIRRLLENGKTDAGD